LRSFAVQFVPEPEICHGAGFILWAGERVRVQDVEQIYMASRAKNDDKRSKEKRTFGPILNIHFLLGWRTRHQAKSVTNNLPILSVLWAGLIYSYLDNRNVKVLNY
jgi:hypothetical protein